jgi:hypothetical protein
MGVVANSLEYIFAPGRKEKRRRKKKDGLSTTQRVKHSPAAALEISLVWAGASAQLAGF